VYRLFNVNADGDGRVRIPADANGLIAFISGANAPTARQDKPVVGGLTPSGAYQILAYHAPKSSEQWQIQFKAPYYPGSKESEWLNGSEVVTEAIAFAHTQGGGTSTYQSEAALRYEPIAMRLPRNSSTMAPKAFTHNAKIQFSGEPGRGEVAYSEIPVIGGHGVSIPYPGGIISLESATTPQGTAIAGTLKIDGLPMGLLKSPLQSMRPYQIGCAFVARKNEAMRVVICVSNSGKDNADSPVFFATDAEDYAAFDTFNLY
jgi:hypothetical protein